MSTTTVKPKFDGSDRRSRYRLSTATKVLVQGNNRFSEVATIVNMTRNGIYFEAFGEYQRGMTVKVTFPYNPVRPSVETPQHAEVVRVQEIAGSMKRGVAVKLLNVFLKL